VTVIDGATNTATTFADDYSPYALAVNPNMNKIYVANLDGGNGTTDAGGNTVTVIDGETKQSPLDTALEPWR
jgi:DNA-binding beta-propeller fold protein YncE